MHRSIPDRDIFIKYDTTASVYIHYTPYYIPIMSIKLIIIWKFQIL